MKSGRVTHIRGAILSTVKRFVFEVPTVDNKFLCTVLTSKCQVSESQKNESYSWVELCSDVAHFGSAAFILLLWKGWRPQSSICFPLWNQSHDPICHFWETAAAPARGSRKGRQKNIICNSRTLPERRKSRSLYRQEFYPEESPEQAGLAVTAVSPLLREENVTPGMAAHSHTAVCSWHSRLCSVFRTPKHRDNWV